MAIVEGQKVKVKWHWSNRSHFEEKGFVFTSYGDEFVVDVFDLTLSQNVFVKVKCDYCNKEKQCKYHKVSKKEYHYCGNSCMFKFKQDKGLLPPKDHNYECDFCNKSFKVENYRYERLKNGEYKNLFCTKKCLSSWNAENSNINRKPPNPERYTIKCATCDEAFTVKASRKDTAKYCSEACKREGNITTRIVKCDNCKKDTKKIQSVLSSNKNIFCSPNCANEYKTKISNEKRQCEYCTDSFITKINSTQRFCSIQCQSGWQSEFLVGENANNYKSEYSNEDRMVNCYWCDSETPSISPYKIKQINEEGKKHFCSKDCYREWYAKEWSQSEEWKQESKERAVKMLEDGVFKTDSKAQLSINQALKDLNIQFDNEYNCKYVSIDNYLPEYNLMIEVMGTYWHADPRKYKEINYQTQVDRIKNDKIKKTYIKNNYKINILYLWEEEIHNNPQLCKELILLYVNKKGIIEDYNSFNYNLKENVLSLSSRIITPYMEYDSKELKPVINITGSKRRSMKQEDKWIKFNCEQCGSEKEQLKSRYRKAKHHFCSHKCSRNFYTIMKQSSR